MSRWKAMSSFASPEEIHVRLAFAPCRKDLFSISLRVSALWSSYSRSAAFDLSESRCSYSSEAASGFTSAVPMTSLSK